MLSYFTNIIYGKIPFSNGPARLSLNTSIVKLNISKMKTKQIWLNLPVKDMEKSKAFFKEIGFTPNPYHENSSHLGSFFIGEKEVVMMLFPEETFKKFTQNEIADTQKGTEILLNIDAQSKEEVDEMCQVVKNAGGKIYAEPKDAEGWMYAFGFEDLDGHRWSVLYMDRSKMPQS